MPADPTQQQAFIDSVTKTYPKAKLDWSVPAQSLEHPDIPNHQAWVPDYAKSKTAWQAFWTKYRTTPERRY